MRAPAEPQRAARRCACANGNAGGFANCAVRRARGRTASVAEYARTMARRRPLTPQQLAEIQEAARRGPDGKPLRGTMRGMIEGTATAPRPVAPPRQPLPSKGQRLATEPPRRLELPLLLTVAAPSRRRSARFSAPRCGGWPRRRPRRTRYGVRASDFVLRQTVLYELPQGWPQK